MAILVLILINLNQVLICGLVYGLKYLYESKGPAQEHEIKLILSLETQFKILATDAASAFTYYTLIVTVFICFVKGERRNNMNNINVDELMHHSVRNISNHEHFEEIQ